MVPKKPAKKTRLWEYFKAASQTKDRSVLKEPEFHKDYLPFLINDAMSYHEDAVLVANQLNQFPTIPPELHFLVLLNTLRSRTRYAERVVIKDSGDVSVVAEYYRCSDKRAREILSLHTPEQLIIMRGRLDKGGASKQVPHASHQHN